VAFKDNGRVLELCHDGRLLCGVLLPARAPTTGAPREAWPVHALLELVYQSLELLDTRSPLQLRML
jgi:hypothetical protein